MSTEKVQSVADEVARRARRQGFVLSQDVRDELTRALRIFADLVMRRQLPPCE